VYNRNINEMEVYVKIIYRDKEWELHGRRRRVRDVIKEVGLVPHAVLAVRDGKLLTEDVMLQDGDEVKLVAVISGG
jgi:sulfur carrier protein